MKKVNLLIIFALIFCFYQGFAQTLDSNAVDGKIYIKIKDYSSFIDLSYSGGSTAGLPEDVKTIISEYSVTSIDRPFLSAGDGKLNRVFRVSFSDLNSINKVLIAFGSIDYIEYSEKIPIDKIACTSDPLTWSSTPNNYHLNLIQACNAWTINQGLNTVRVAILDNECDVNHTDLVGRVTTWFDVADNDNNVLGTSTLNHGTHVTGIVGANTNNGTGIASLGRGLDLIFGKIAQNSTGQLTAGYAGMIWAVANGARVINCSWGGAYYSQTNFLVVNWVTSQNVIICAAAGNSNINAPHYPAAFPGVYSVGASNQSNSKAAFSNWGPWVDIAAPGVSIFSTISSAVSGPNAYASLSGTSMATPMVTALCGLIMSNNALYTPAMVLNCISSTAVPLFPGNPIGNRIDAFAALQCSGGLGNAVQFSASANHICANSSVSFTDNSITTSLITNWSWTFTSLNNTITSNLQNPTITFAAAGIYSVVLTVTTASGTFTNLYPTDIYVVGLNSAGFSSAGSYCKNNESQVSFTFDNFPELVINYNINGGAVTTLSLTNQYVTTQDIMFNTPNANNMNINISTVSDNVITCPTSINFTTVLVDCCPNLVANGNFEAGNVSYASDLTYCFNTLSPGYQTDYFYSQNPPTTLIPPRGLRYLHIDGPWTGNTLASGCSPPLVVPSNNNPGFGVILYEGTANLISGSDYILSFVHSNPNINFYSGSFPLIFPYDNSIFRVSLVGTSGNVFSTIYTPNPSNDEKWYQYKRDLTGLITATGTYSVIVEQMDHFNGLAYDYFFDDVSINAINNLSSSITPNLTNLCAPANVNLVANATNSFGALTYNWTSTPTGVYPNNQSINPFVNTTTSFAVSIQDGNLCTTTSLANVNINTPPTITASASSPTVCSAFPSTILTANGASTYAWLPGPPFSGTSITVNPTATTLYTVTGTTAAGCTNSVTVLVTYTTCGACTNCAAAIGTSGTVNGGTILNNTYCLNNNVTVNGNATINGCELRIGAGFIITIAPTATLNITKSHLYSCGDMWQGIVIQNGGVLKIDNSLIEDAFVAIDVTGNTQAVKVYTLQSTTFNRNDIAINIKGYTQTVPTYPFSMTNCMITCRNIAFTPGSLIFPASSNIGSSAPSNLGLPFTNSLIDNTIYAQTANPAAFLKAPFAANTKPTAGIRLTNVGVTQNPQTTAPTYYEFVVGGTGNKNIIDNQRVGVDLIQSNFTTYNATYQNMCTYGKGSSQGGIGINANAGDAGNNRLRVTSVLSLTAITGNKFVDCSRAINSVNYFEHIISFNDIRSSQSTASATLNHRGEFGVKSVTNRFRIYNVSSNTVYNVQNGIIMDGTFGTLNISTIPTSGQYAGKINIDKNVFDTQISGPNISTNFIGDAIAVSNISSTHYTANASYPIFQTANNTITKAYRGVLYKNWTRINCIINSNSITLVNDVFVSNNVQYGINMTGCSPAAGQSSVRVNDVAGYGITNPKLVGIISANSTGNLVSCNTTTNTTGGIAFAGLCGGASFSQNIMNTNLYGFALSGNGAFTGPLGATNIATDNRWTGLWPAGVRYKTATLSSASAAGNELWVRGPNPSQLNPNTSGFTSGIYNADDYYNPVTLKYVTAAPINPPCPVLSSGGGGTNPAVSNFIQQLEQIALDQVAYAANQIVQARFINKANLLSLLKGDPTLTAGSPILQTFTATSVNTSRDKFVNVETKTADGNLATANSINASISPTINVESNHKDFYNTLLNYANQSLTTSDSITVVNLSHGCPFTDGSVVYQARALYNVMFDTYQVFIDNCDENTSNSRLMKQETEETKDLSSLFDAAIFPNPGTGNFNIATFGLTEGNVDITVCDMNGRVVYENKLQVANALCNFTIDVKSGVYFVKIHDSSLNKTLIKKLVVQQ